MGVLFEQEILTQPTSKMVSLFPAVMKCSCVREIILLCSANHTALFGESSKKNLQWLKYFVPLQRIYNDSNL